MAALEGDDIWGEGGDPLKDMGVDAMTTEDLRQRRQMIENETRIIKSEFNRISHQSKAQKEKIKENYEKIKLNKQLPYLVGHVVEILDIDKSEEDDIGQAAMDEDTSGCKSVVVKTSTRQTIYLPMPGLVDPKELKPGELVGTNKDRYMSLGVFARRACVSSPCM